MRLEHKNVLFVGATGPFAEALAVELAGRGATLVLADPSPDEALAALARRGVREGVEAIRLDLSDREGVEAGLDALGDRTSEIDGLVVNAGPYLGGLLEEQDADEIREILQIGLLGPIHVVRALLPRLLARPEATIVLGASVNGTLHVPLMTTYTAAKSGLVAFSEALRRELRGTRVGTLLLVTPALEGATFRRARSALRAHLDVSRWRAEDAVGWARRVVDAIETDRRHLLPRGRMRLLLAMARHFPALYDRWIWRSFRREPTASPGSPVPLVP